MNEYVDRVRNDDRGFTLIELMIVIVILGILAGIVIFAVGGITDRGSVAACKTDLKTIEVAVEAYYAKHGAFAPNLKPTLTDRGTTATSDNFLRDDPSFGAGTTSSVWDPGNGYTIVYHPVAATGFVAGEVSTTGGVC